MEEFMPKAIAFASQHTVMVIAWVVVFIGTIYVFVKSAVSGAKEIDQATLSQLVNKQNAVIIDLRSIEEFFAWDILPAVKMCYLAILNSIILVNWSNTKNNRSLSFVLQE